MIIQFFDGARADKDYQNPTALAQLDQLKEHSTRGVECGGIILLLASFD